MKNFLDKQSIFHNYFYCKEFLLFSFILITLGYTKIGLLFLGILIFLLYFKISRTLLKNIFLPKPGDGPSEKLRNNGYFILELIGIQNKQKFILTISCNSDPGYSGTAIMIAESAITLALNRNDTPNTFGVLTPTTGMGEALIKRLIKSGMKFEFNSKIIK